VRIARLQREEASIAQYKDNIGALSSRMTQSETVLSSINSDMLSTRDLLVWALDGGNTAEDLSAMATSLEALRDGLYASTLTKDQEGTYLFSGTLSKTPTLGWIRPLPPAAATAPTATPSSRWWWSATASPSPQT
jgi:flagellar hook-associated protein 3 FlgL